jgi:hypothetical protein
MTAEYFTHLGVACEHGERLNKGPFQKLCNLQLAVARVLKISAAADSSWNQMKGMVVIPSFFLIASEEFCNILHAKFLLLGRLFSCIFSNTGLYTRSQAVIPICISITTMDTHCTPRRERTLLQSLQNPSLHSQVSATDS